MPCFCRSFASFAEVVVLPEPWRPTIIIFRGRIGERPVSPSPRSFSSSSLIIFTICWPGVTDLMTSSPTHCAFTLSMNSLATLKCTSAESRALRTSSSAAAMFSSVSFPRPRRLRSAFDKFSVSPSSIFYSFFRSAYCAAMRLCFIPVLYSSRRIAIAIRLWLFQFYVLLGASHMQCAVIQ